MKYPSAISHISTEQTTPYLEPFDENYKNVMAHHFSWKELPVLLVTEKVSGISTSAQLHHVPTIYMTQHNQCNGNTTEESSVHIMAHSDYMLLTFEGHLETLWLRSSSWQQYWEVAYETIFYPSN